MRTKKIFIGTSGQRTDISKTRRKNAMKIRRFVEMTTDSFMVGDQITVEVEDLGSFTATAHRITEQGNMDLPIREDVCR